MKISRAIVLFCIICAIQGRSITQWEDLKNYEELENLQYDPAHISNNTHFLLWTRQNPVKAVELKVGDEKILQESGYNNTLPTKIFAHGWNSNGYSGNAPNIRDEYLKREDCNFISVDWEKLAAGINYINPARNTKYVGELTGQLVNFLLEHDADLKNFHIIGFSLGAHVAGKTGATVNGVVPRITGLDPAYPLFSIKNTDSRLDTTDAEFVDVVHTNSGTLIHDSLSFPQAIGHVDFFVNGGHSQPGCGIISGDIIDLIHGCSHERAPEYFKESINSPIGFMATLCDSYDHYKKGSCSANPTSLMGEPVADSVRGTFYLTTNKKSPFAKQ